MIPGPARQRISVVIPAYDAEGHIAGALESVAAQERPPDEVVVVDDGSTDRTAALVEAWMRDARPETRLLRGPNRGLSAALNRGIGSAGGDLIARLDADDRYVPEHLAVLERGLADHPDAVLAFGNATLVSVGEGETGTYFDGTCLDPAAEGAAGQAVARPGGEPALDQGGGTAVGPDDGATGGGAFRRLGGSAYASLVGGSFIPTGATLFRREAALEAGLFDVRFPTANDRGFWLRLSRVGAFVCTPRILARVRRHEDNLTHPRHSTALERERIALLLKMRRSADDLSLSGAERRATEEALLRHASSLLFWASLEGPRAYARNAAYLWRRGLRRPVLDPKHSVRALLPWRSASPPGRGAPGGPGRGAVERQRASG